MKNGFFFVLLFITFSAFTQKDVVTKVNPLNSDTTIYTLVDQDATFPDDNSTMMKYIQSNLIFPEDLDINDFCGKTFLRFIVEKDGSLTQIEVLRCKNAQLIQIYKNLLANMPKWNPALVNGIPVRQRYTLPITICF